MTVFILMAVTDPYYFFSWVFIVTFSICIHEFSHAITAYKLGDDTAAQAGHLTLNPVVQMGWQSLCALLLMGIAWGAVPVNPYLLGRRRWMVSIAGPLANLLLCVVFALAAVLSDRLFASAVAYQFLAEASVANAMLAIFNMLPIPMLDGWSVYAALIPRMDAVDRNQSQNLSWTLLILVCITPLIDVIWATADSLAGNFIGMWVKLAGLFA